MNNRTPLSFGISINLNTLNEFFRRFLTVFLNSSDAPLEFIYTSLLPSLGAAISTRRWIRWGNKCIYPNFWTMLVGPSTLVRKTTSIDTGLYFNLQFDMEHPERSFMLPNDGSFAAFLKVLEEEKQGVIKHSEVASLLESMKKGYNNSMKSQFTDFFDVPNTHKIRLKGESDINIEKPIFSMATATTVNWLKQNITKNDRESGFLARFLYCHKDRKDRSIAIPKSTKQEAMNEFRVLYERLFSLEPREITFDASYERIYEHYYGEIETLYEDPLLDDGTKSLIGRLQTDYFLKLTILECVLNGKDTATADVAERVLSQIGFFINQAFVIMDKILKTDRTKNEDKVIEFLKISQRVTSTDLYHLFRNKIHASNLKSIMKVLTDAQLVRQYSSGKVTYYELFDKIRNEGE